LTQVLVHPVNQNFPKKLSNQNRAISARFPPSCWGKITMAPLIWVFFYEKSIISKGYVDSVDIFFVLHKPPCFHFFVLFSRGNSQLFLGLRAISVDEGQDGLTAHHCHNSLNHRKISWEIIKETTTIVI